MFVTGAPAVLLAQTAPRKWQAVQNRIESGEIKGFLGMEDIPTPALLLDLDAFEANVKKMTDHCRTHNRTLRPHGKTHKTPEIANRLIRAGAVGCCAAKLSEAEAFAAGGVKGLLVTTAVIGKYKIERAAALAQSRPDTIFSVDDLQNVRDLDEAAKAARTRLNLAIDLYVGNRTGIATGERAVELAQAIAKLKNVRLAGLQAYAGHASHRMGFEDRASFSRQCVAPAVETRRAIEKAGIECPLLTGGSTGTYNIDAEIDGTTELQPGSFLFMDVDYSRIGGKSGAVYQDFRTSLTVLTTVVSQPSPNDVVTDGGLKAFSTDKPFPPEAIRMWRGGPQPFSGATFAWGGDEHGKLNLAKASGPLRVGDKVEFVVPHCDPTVNLYDRMYVYRGTTPEAVWKITARGASQ
jgi:D-serine deaminase-like pyridoxal phosphate-dependent protein